VRTAVRIAIATAAVLGIGALLARRIGEKGTPAPAEPVARPIRVLPPDSVIAGPVLEEHPVGDYLVRVVADSVARERIVDIKLHGHRVFAVRAADARLEHVGEPLTGGRTPGLVIQAFSGGMHCCSQATVIALGPQFKVLGTIDGADGEIVFDDLDGDGIPEVKLGDWRFAYWRDYAFVDTQVPDVILRWKDGAYRPACDLMAGRPPSPAALARRARDLTANWAGGDPPAEFWGFAVDLIYNGNADLAWQWLDRSWPRSIGGKDDFVRELRKRLDGSPCWSPAPEGRTTT
jgi:hypothetical protein